MKSDDPAIRRAVAVDLGRLRDESEHRPRVELLRLALRDNHSEVRKQAVVSLADLVAREATNDILPLLTDVEISVRQMAVLALGEVARPEDIQIVGRLASLVNAGDASIRYQALAGYVSLSPKEAVFDVVDKMSDEDLEIRELAVRLVDEIYCARGMDLETFRDPVIEAAQDTEFRVRAVAQLLCCEQRWEAPKDAILAIVDRTVRAREPRDEQTAIFLCGELGLASSESGLRRRAFGLLGMSFDPFRWAALTALSKMGDRRAIERLMKGLRARSFTDRTLAVEGLGDAAIRDALPALQKLQGKDSLVDQEILGVSLGKLGA